MKVGIAGTTGLIGGEVQEVLSQEHTTYKIGRYPDDDYTVDFTNPTEIDLDLDPLDAVVHCAGVVDAEFEGNPTSGFIHGTSGMESFLEAVFESSVSSFIYISTVHVYGHLSSRITDETPVNPLSDYGVTHYASEQILRRFTEETSLTGLVLRPCAVFGMPHSPNRFDRWHLIPYLFPNFCVWDQQIELLTHGDQKRNFVSTKDLAGYIRAFLNRISDFTNLTCANAVGQETLSVYEFAERCAEVYESETDEKCKITRPEKKEDRTSDETFEYSTNLEFYQPEASLDTYLEEMISFLQSEKEKGIRYGE